MNFLKSMSIYTIAAVLNAAVPFLLLPVFTTYLDPSDYGILAILTTIMAFLSPFIVFGVSSLVGVDFFKLSKEDLSKNFGTIIYIPLFMGIILFILMCLFGNLLSVRFSIPIEWVYALPFITLLTFLPQTLGIIYRSQNQPLQFAFFQILQTIFNILISVILVVQYEMSWQGRMYAIIISGIIFSFVSYYLLYKMLLIKFNFSSQVIQRTLKFGIGLIPHSVGGLVVRMSDRLFIVAIVGLNSAGQYAVGVQVASIMFIIISTFNQAWSPYLFQNLSAITDEKKKALVTYSYYVMGAFLLIAIVLNFIAPLIYSVFINEKFHESIKFIPWMSVGYFFTAVYLTFVDYIFYEKKTHILSIITMFNVILNLLLNYLFIQKYGAIGATYAFAISMFFVMCLTWLLSNKFYPMPWFYWLKRSNNVN